MRIVHCASALDGGGAEKQLAYLARQQARDGCEVHIAHPVGRRRLEPAPICGVRLHPLAAAASADPLLAWRLVRLFRKLRPQIVQTWHLQMHVLAGLASLATGVPFIVREFGSGGPREGYTRARALAQRALVRRADAIVSNSRGADMFWSPVLPPERRFIVSNAVPLDAIAAAVPTPGTTAQRPVIVHAGRFVEGKNITTLVAALIIVLRHTPGFALLLGDGPLRPVAEHAMRAEGLAARCLLPGHVPSIWGDLKAADMFISLSRHEGRPNAVLEAMACECPLIVSDIAAHREFLSERTAVLVRDFDDPDAVASAIIKLLTDPRAGRDRARAARASLGPECNIAAVARSYERVYETVLAARATRGRQPQS